MNRAIPALVIASIIAAGTMLILSLLIGGDWVSENPNTNGIDVSGDSNSGPIPVSSISLERCEDVIDRFESLIESSRACDSSSDCQIVVLGCPFGCSSSVNSRNVATLFEEQSKIERCLTCAYNCRFPPLGWESECVSNQCQLVENSVDEFERATREAVAN